MVSKISWVIKKKNAGLGKSESESKTWNVRTMLYIFRNCSRLMIINEALMDT